MASSSSSSTIATGLKKKKQIIRADFIALVGAVLPHGVPITDRMGRVATNWVLLEDQLVELEIQEFSLSLGYTDLHGPTTRTHLNIVDADMLIDEEDLFRFFALTSSSTPMVFGVEVRVPTDGVGGAAAGGGGGPRVLDNWTLFFNLAKETEVRRSLDQLKLRFKTYKKTNLVFEGLDETPSPPDDDNNNNNGSGGGASAVPASTTGG